MNTERACAANADKDWLGPTAFLAAYAASAEGLREKLVSFPSSIPGAPEISRPVIDPEDLVKSKRDALATLEFIASRAELRLMVRRRPVSGDAMYGFFDGRGALLHEASPTDPDLTKWLKSRIEAAALARECLDAPARSLAHRL